MDNLDLKLSVLSAEPRYNLEYSEPTYSADQIVSYGSDNAAPKLFMDCYKNSATLGSIINGNIAYILGDEITVTGSFAEEMNRTGMTMRQFIAHLALDYQVYGGFAFQVIYSKLFVPVELYPLDFSKCRTNESGTKIFYSKKGWTKYSTKSEVFDRFNLSKIDPNKMTQIFYFKGDFTRSVYPLPPYMSALNDVLTEIECSKYSLSTVSNGFSARYLLEFPSAGNLTNEQKSGIEASIKNKFCGASPESSFMLYWKDGDEGLSIQKIESDDTPEKYLAIKDNCRSNIYTSMRCYPTLFGLPTNTGFNTDEYKDSFKIYYKTVIQPYQDVIIEAIEKVIGKGTVEIKPFLINWDR